MYDLPNNITRFYQLFDYANYATSNWFGISIVVLIFIVLFFALKNYDTPRAFAAASSAAKVMKANPFDLPVSLSFIRATSVISP